MKYNKYLQDYLLIRQKTLPLLLKELMKKLKYNFTYVCNQCLLKIELLHNVLKYDTSVQIRAHQAATCFYPASK